VKTRTRVPLYTENPAPNGSLAKARQLSGIALSFINLFDLDGAWNLVCSSILARVHRETRQSMRLRRQHSQAFSSATPTRVALWWHYRVQPRC
jgi:hypothetical protein